jgi:hypothetical protein
MDVDLTLEVSALNLIVGEQHQTLNRLVSVT